MVRVWNVSHRVGKRSTVIVNKTSLRPAESVLVDDALWERLKKNPHLTDVKPVPTPAPAPAPVPKPAPKPKPIVKVEEPPAPESELTPAPIVNLDEMTKAELLWVAVDSGIDAKSSMTKAEIRALLEGE